MKARRLLCALALCSCASGPPTLAQTVADSVYLQSYPPEVEVIAVTLGPRNGKLGECVLMPDGKKWLQIHLGEIRERYGTAWTYEAVRQVVDHEWHHALNACKDADHYYP